MIRNSKPARVVTALTAFALVTSSLTTPAFAQRVEVGNAASVVGKVEIKPVNVKKKRKIKRKERIAWGDMITTGGKSQMQILLLDRSSFGIGSKSQVRIDRFVYDPSKGRSVVATFLKGALRYFSGRKGASNDGTVQTRAGRIGIRGTAVDILVGDWAEDVADIEEDAVPELDDVDSDHHDATLTVLRGPGAATQGGLEPGLVTVEAAGVTVTLDEPGEAAYIPRVGAAPFGPFRISDEGLAEVQKRMAPTVARANDGGNFLGTLLPVAAGLGAVAAGVLLGQEENCNAANAAAGVC